MDNSQNNQNQQAPQQSITSEPDKAISSTTTPNLNSSLNKNKHTSIWFLILLFIVFQPVALFIIFKEKYYHRWLPILLWLYAIPLFLTYLVLRTSVIPQLDILYRTLDVPNSLKIINLLTIFFMAVLLMEIIFGFILFRKNKSTHYLSKNLLVITLLFFVMNFILSPAFIIIGIVNPIYHLASTTESKIQSTPTQYIPVSPTIDETTNWKIYTDPQYHYTFKYPDTWTYKSLGNATQFQSNLPDFLNKSYDTFFDIKNSLDSKGLPLFMSISVYNNIGNWSLEQWVNQLKSSSGGSFVSQENIQIAGSNAIRAKINPEFEVIYGSYTSNDKTSNILYSIVLGGNGEGGSNYSDTDPFVIKERTNFINFISTFKFTQ